MIFTGHVHVGLYSTNVQKFLKDILSRVYLQDVNFGSEFYYNDEPILSMIKSTILNDSYDDVFTVIEYIVQAAEELFNLPNIYEEFNELFEKEFVGYRFVNKYIIAITNKNEIASIETASNTPYKKVNDFFIKATELMSDRENPDYENSIKESISAVEEICNIILCKPGTLGASLKKIEDVGVIIHPSLKSAFEKLYGYTSDASGIRHAGQLGGSNATFAEAKFMLVACSAFINYLIDNIK